MTTRSPPGRSTGAPRPGSGPYRVCGAALPMSRDGRSLLSSNGSTSASARRTSPFSPSTPRRLSDEVDGVVGRDPHRGWFSTRTGEVDEVGSEADTNLEDAQTAGSLKVRIACDVRLRARSVCARPLLELRRSLRRSRVLRAARISLPVLPDTAASGLLTSRSWSRGETLAAKTATSPSSSRASTTGAIS